MFLIRSSAGLFLGLCACFSTSPQVQAVGSETAASPEPVELARAAPNATQGPKPGAPSAAPERAPTTAEGSIPTPEAHLGRPLGRDFELADWAEVSSYWLKLSEASARVEVQVAGQTTEGRDFLVAAISSAANLERSAELREYTARLADPRGLTDAERETLLSKAKPVLAISLGMHSNEVAAPQFGMELAYRLATSNEEPYRSAREQMIVVVFPCTNPDGLDEIVNWYRETVGTPFEGSGLPVLYQRYAGHDNNRDWFMLSQMETRIVTEQLYRVWHPQVYWDVHQQGSTRERFFLPPFRDPLNPNLDAGVIATIDALGSRALLDMTRAGLTGISTGVSYDMWWNGGNRNVPVRHNIAGLLTEAASADYASPLFLSLDDLRPPSGLKQYAPSNRFPAPWPGGWWRLRNIIEYEHAFARSLLGSLAREPRTWTSGALEAAERALELGREGTPRAWILPSNNRDVGAARRLTDALLRAGVEVFVAAEELRADGRLWPTGSIVIEREQPFGAHVADLFETQRYPEGDAPYDVAGWTLPMLLGLHRVEVVGAIEGRLEPALRADTAVAGFGGKAAPSGLEGAVDTGNSDGWVRILTALSEGESVWMQCASPDGSQSPQTEAGAASGPENSGANASETEAGAEPDPATAEGSAGWAWVGGEAPHPSWVRVESPRIGLYAPWTGSMDEGWARWLFDEFSVPYLRIRNEMLRAGQLRNLLDVLVLPSVSGRTLSNGRRSGTVPELYSGGLDPEGAVAIEEFVRAGGRVVALGSASAWAVDLFDLPLKDAARENREFACPGSVLRGIPQVSSWTAGLPQSVPLFFSRSMAWAPVEEKSSPGTQARVRGAAGQVGEPEYLLRYASKRLLLSGWIQAEEAIAGSGAWVRVPVGEGDVHLFGFRPQYRSWSQACFGLLFRSMLLPN